MAHQISLTDDEYETLANLAQGRGQPVEVLVHDAIQRYAAATMGSYEYPTGELDTPENEAEDEAIAQRIGSQQPWLSEMVIEDRGPRG